MECSPPELYWLPNRPVSTVFLVLFFWGVVYHVPGFTLSFSGLEVRFLIGFMVNGQKMVRVEAEQIYLRTRFACASHESGQNPVFFFYI